MYLKIGLCNSFLKGAQKKKQSYVSVMGTKMQNMILDIYQYNDIILFPF